MPYTLTRDDLEKSGACPDRREAALAEIKVWPATADDAFAAGLAVDDVLWIACAVARKRGDAELLRRLRHCMADIAAEALPIYEKHAPGDMRVRDCIAAARKFAQGEIGLADLAAARSAARSAARFSDAANAAARAAAWDAAWDAASAAAWAAARDAADAARNAAWAADAASAAAWDAADAARSAARFSDAASAAASAAARAAAWDAARNAAWAAASDAAWAAAWDDARAAQKAIICRWLSDTPPVQAEEEA